MKRSSRRRNTRTKRAVAIVAGRIEEWRYRPFPLAICRAVPFHSHSFDLDIELGKRILSQSAVSVAESPTSKRLGRLRVVVNLRSRSHGFVPLKIAHVGDATV